MINKLESLSKSNGLAWCNDCVYLTIEFLLEIIVDDKSCFGYCVVNVALSDKFFLHVFFIIGIFRKENLFDVFELELRLLGFIKKGIEVTILNFLNLLCLCTNLPINLCIHLFIAAHVTVLDGLHFDRDSFLCGWHLYSPSFGAFLGKIWA